MLCVKYIFLKSSHFYYAVKFSWVFSYIKVELNWRFSLWNVKQHYGSPVKCTFSFELDGDNKCTTGGRYEDKS
jgi:hypothetical protein